MIQLRKTGVVAAHDDVERLKAEFQKKQCVLLPKLLEPALLDLVLARLESGHWVDKIHEGIGVELILDDLPAWHLLHFLSNAPAFLGVVQEITGCSTLTWFGGRVYRLVPNSGHYDSWHGDCADGRLIAMSLNLSPRGYRGGIFQLREREPKTILTEIANIGFGNATLFRIAKHLDHQVTEVIGVEPKTAFAGWFQTGKPSFAGLVRNPASSEAHD